MKYFSLHNHCYLVEGEKNLALYDLFTKRIFWIRDDFGKIFLKLSHSGKNLEEISKRTEKTVSEVARCAGFYEAVDLGMLHEGPVVSQKFRPIVTRDKELKEGVHRPLKEVVMEVSGQCSLGCRFCGFENHLITSKCFCGIWSPLQKKITYDISSIVRQLALYQTEQITIAGGDPFENRDDLYGIVYCAANNNIPVTIQSPRFSLADKDWGIIKENDAVLLLVLFAVDSLSASAITTGKNPLFERWLMEAHHHEHHKLMVKVLLGPEAFPKIVDIQHYLERNGIEHSMIEKFAPLDMEKPSKERREKIINMMSGNSHDQYAVDLGTFLRLNKGHICWQDRVAIGINGDVLPCIVLRDHVIGNVGHKELVDILREDWADQYKNIDLSEIKPCGNCEFRNGCVSCSVMTREIFGSWKRKAWNCRYDPDRGDWLDSVLPLFH